MLAGLARDVVLLLGSDVEHESERRNQIVDPDDPLAALEADVADIAEAIAAEENPAPVPPLDSAIQRLLPDMSEDPHEAGVLRELTENSVAAAKIENLVTFYQGLEALPPGNDVIFVPNENAAAWMAALNDIRLVVAARLNITDDDSSAAVYARAGMFTGSHSRNADDLPVIETTDDMLAVLYTMTTWWQDSLVTAVRNKAARR
ncbi:Domain of uncharacterised function (DUF2017) [Trueperella bialowiezensis]|uniref:Domain of uncharacterized function (DUF2017) n=2 Tax=Trueperella bialowiezensis TaxID=312285 RepID=A0A3S4V811_9ACTO|nr:Domain of uncharacterised function (DUF2017) [Trueperella bialowiezensis]